MKKDSSNPKRTSNDLSQEQECTQKVTSTHMPDISRRVKNVVHVSDRFILAPANEANSRVGDNAKVAEIKQAIIEGRFKVNPEVVADRLLETVKELIQAKKNIT